MQELDRSVLMVREVDEYLFCNLIAPLETLKMTDCRVSTFNYEVSNI